MSGRDRTPTDAARRPRIVVVGCGFAGFHAARALRRLAAGSAEVVVINPTDYFLYLPLLPEVAGGILDPRRVCVSIPQRLPEARLLLGTVERIDPAEGAITRVDPEGNRDRVHYDRLILAAGSVNKLLPVPGIAEHAHGFRNVAEALCLRDHLVEQIELAAVSTDPAERAERCTFVVVGAGYTGTEVAAQGQLLTEHLVGERSSLRGRHPRWILLDLAPRLLPGLDPRLSRTAERVLARRGIQIRTRESVAEAVPNAVRLTSGELVATRTLVWCVGVRPDPLVAELGLPIQAGRLTVDDHLAVPGHPEIFACGDCAAVPDLTRPGSLTAMTAQHAQRQGRLAGKNAAASLGFGERRRYRHRDLGFLVDLGGLSAAADPLGVPISGLPAKVVTRGYHLFSLPGNRIRTAAEWSVETALPRQAVQLGIVGAGSVPLDAETVRTDGGSNEKETT